MPSKATRPFSTTSGVHPAYLPSLHKASKVEKRLVPAAVATVGIVYGISAYRQSQLDQQHAEPSQPANAAAAAKTTASNATADTAASRRASEEAMMNAYGDRSSLAELESAIAAYEAQRKR